MFAFRCTHLHSHGHVLRIDAFYSLTSHSAVLTLSKSAPIFDGSSAFSLPCVFNVSLSSRCLLLSSVTRTFKRLTTTCFPQPIACSILLSAWQFFFRSSALVFFLSEVHCTSLLCKPCTTPKLPVRILSGKTVCSCVFRKAKTSPMKLLFGQSNFAGTVAYSQYFCPSPSKQTSTVP